MINYSGSAGSDAYAHNTIASPQYASGQMADAIRIATPLDSVADRAYMSTRQLLYDGKEAKDRRFDKEQIRAALDKSVQAGKYVIPGMQETKKPTEIIPITRRAPLEDMIRRAA